MPLVPSYIKKLSSYKPGKPIGEVERELGIRNIIKLASNENPLGPSPKAIKAVQSNIQDFHRYPDASGYDLRKKLAKIFVENSPYETRLQVLYFLFGVAKADGNVSQSELSKIDQIASALGIRISDFESIKAMFFEDSDSAYKILEISPNVSDSEVKKAYREMAKKYHPDKLQSKDPALIKGAQEKFQEVQKAYETIQNERGL